MMPLPTRPAVRADSPVWLLEADELSLLVLLALEVADDEGLALLVLLALAVADADALPVDEALELGVLLLLALDDDDAEPAIWGRREGGLGASVRTVLGRQVSSASLPGAGPLTGAAAGRAATG
jgi:hypothetical protein